MVETEKESEGSMPDHCQCIPSTSSSSDKLVKQPIKAEQIRSANKPLSKKGFVVRPWRGPLPKRQPSEITLEAFFPKKSEKFIPEKSASPTRPCRDILIERARNFGRSWWDVFPTGPRLAKNSSATKPSQGNTVPSSNPSPYPAPSTRVPMPRPSFVDVERRTAAFDASLP